MAVPFAPFDCSPSSAALDRLGDVACPPSQAHAPSTTDPRATLDARNLDGIDAGVAAQRHRVARQPRRSRPDGSTRRTRATSAFVNSDLAFQGDHAFIGNFNGFLIYNIADPANPTLRTAVVCPGGQGEVSVYGNLLFMSARRPAPSIDCTSTPAATGNHAPFPRRAHLRHLEPRRAGAGRGGPDLSRLAHAHAAEEPERREQPLRVHQRDGHRPAGDRAGGLQAVDRAADHAAVRRGAVAVADRGDQGSAGRPVDRGDRQRPAVDA